MPLFEQHGRPPLVKTGRVIGSADEQARLEAEALKAWARHHAFVVKMEAGGLLTAQQAATLGSEDARQMWLWTFLGTLGSW